MTKKSDLAPVILEGGERVLAHMPDKCKAETCTIHNPSEHHMRDWPQHWRADRGIMERICEHGIGHPDPDDTNLDTTHGCDGCCRVNGERPDGGRIIPFLE